jgi:hypothetical protein
MLSYRATLQLQLLAITAGRFDFGKLPANRGEYPLKAKNLVGVFLGNVKIWLVTGMFFGGADF